MPHAERHRSEHIGWLCASVLGANDGIVSTASLILGISEIQGAGPVLVALGSAGSFAVGALLPLLISILVPATILPPVVVGTSLVFLAVLRGVAARVGGARALVGAWRVTFWGALAMALTYGVGALFHTVV